MTRTCPDCGRTWDRAGSWCGACGASLPPSPDSAGSADRPRRGSHVAAVGRRPAVGPVVGLAAIALAVGVVVVVNGGAPDRRPEVTADETVDGAVDVPTDAPVGTDVEDAGVPMELLATCDGPDGPEGCVRWVQRAGQVPRPGTRPLVTTVTDRVVALDPDTGARRWSAAASPPVAPPAGVGDDTVLVEDSTGVRALDAEDGDERWRAPGQHLTSTPPDAHVQDVVVLDDLDGTLVGVDVAEGRTLWTRPAPTQWGLGLPAAVIPVSPDRAVVARPDAIWMVDVHTGRASWSAGTAGRPPEVPVAVTDEHVVTVLADTKDDEPAEFLVRRTSGERLAQFQLPEPQDVRTLAIDDGHLLLRLPDTLTAVDLDDGTVTWRRPVRGNLVTSRPVRLSAIGAMPGPLRSGTIATRSWSVVLLGTDGTATVLDARNGRGARVLGEPADGIQLSDGFLTRRRLWRVDASSLEIADLLTLEVVLRLELRAPPVVVSTDPVIIATSGRLVRLDVSGAAGDPPDAG